ncbi:hypothetical protein L596_009104 [Steinernema carpocapsae]|uniref:Cap-specific mRNA (nucleoside-2'-O-)-methyltransferase 1 n=1 Tax=Steinernema carpocapsae TaxID=34508 RepID=A0A4U5PEG1_STECR|nr:hypothetical protein L596_009104 [Steinernema carpocapsae]
MMERQSSQSIVEFLLESMENLLEMSDQFEKRVTLLETSMTAEKKRNERNGNKARRIFAKLENRLKHLEATAKVPRPDPEAAAPLLLEEEGPEVLASYLRSIFLDSDLHFPVQALARDANVVWDETVEEETVEEKPIWMDPAEYSVRKAVVDQLRSGMEDWIVVGKEKLALEGEDKYCEENLLVELLNAKSVFDHFSTNDLNEARQRANPYETIGNAFFLNRSAMKIANLDRIFDWILSKEESDNREVKNPVDPTAKPQNVDRNAPIFYFADVCAGPGGFSEYMLWRKGFYNAKGFGFTLKRKYDYKLFLFQAGAPEFFEPYYGVDNDGNVMSPANIASLREVVKRGTKGNGGVDLMMADGGFSVEGQENIQEILSKRLYLCQFLVSLSIVRPERDGVPGGNFVCKLFDIYTPFSIGLIYLMYIAYRRISLHKCHTSRPANSERYIMCEGLTEEGATIIREYFTAINNKLDEIQNVKSKKKDFTDDVMEIVPESVIYGDSAFMNYILEHNNRLARRQIQYLNKYRVFQIDMDQTHLRENYLKYWRVPDLPRNNRDRDSPYQAFGRMCGQQLLSWDSLGGNPKEFSESILQASKSFARVAQYYYCAYTERSLPSVFLTLNNGTVFHRGMEDRYWNRYDGKIKIARNSMFLAHTTFRYQTKNHQVFKAKKILRIVDAANLAGDNVSKLAYPARMRAAKKFCDVLEQFGNTVEGGTELVAAEVYSIEDLGSVEFQVKSFQNEMIALIEDPSASDASLLQVHSMRVVNLLKDQFDLCWSRSQKMLYVSHRQGKMKTTFLNDLRSGESEAFTGFWDLLATKKRRGNGGQDDSQDKQLLWRWAQKIQSTSSYGPQAIVTEEARDDGATLNSLKEQLNGEYERLNCGGASFIGDLFRK